MFPGEKEIVMTPLRQQMLDAMIVRGLALRTQEAYVDTLSRMARYFGRSPAQLDAAQIEGYMLHLIKDLKRSYSTVNHVAAASRFLFTHVLARPDEGARMLPPVARTPQKQPELLARSQIAALFAVCHQPMVRMLLQVLYASGLRIREGCHLRVRDIDSHPDRMCLRVVQGKGSADRTTLLSPTLLSLLREHCKRFQCHRHEPDWLFFNTRTHAPLSECGVQRHYQAAKAAAQIHKLGSTHTLRHCCATHLLECGVDLHTIGSLLGHGHLETTRRYLHLISPQFRAPQGGDPLDLLAALPDARTGPPRPRPRTQLKTQPRAKTSPAPQH
jgi:integrase/recombinase XerD